MPPSIVHWTSPEYDYVVTRAARNNLLQTKAEGCNSVKMKRRNYDSCCAKRKQKAAKKRIADTLPKLTIFFTPAAATAAAAELATGSAVGVLYCCSPLFSDVKTFEKTTTVGLCVYKCFLSHTPYVLLPS